MQSFVVALLFAVFLLNGCAVEKQKFDRAASSIQPQQKFEPTPDSMRDAIAHSHGKEFLAAMEDLGSRAEREEDWAMASMAYTRASAVAGQTGQLQKAILHGNKAVDLAQKARAPGLEATAIRWLADGYRSLGQLERQREWLKKGLEIAKQNPAAMESTIEARLSGQLGESFMEQGEADKAIEYISYSVQVLEKTLIYTYQRARRVRGLNRLVSTAESNTINGFNRLGHAFLQAGNAQEAIKAFQRGLAIAKTSISNAPAEGSLVLGMGRVYLAQKDFPRALENFAKALQMAEARRQTSLIQSASSAIGDILLQTHREKEAIQYYRKALDSIESTRSLLESEEFRTSFFGNKGQTYGGIILANLEIKNIDEAFNYNERARSRAFLDILGTKVGLLKENALVEEETNLRTKLSELRAKLAGQREEDENAPDSGQGQQKRELEVAEKTYTEFLTRVQKENKEQASLMNVEPLILQQLQELIDPGVTVLEYFVVQGRAVLWIVNKDRVEVVRLSLDRQELVSKVTAFRESITELGEKAKLDALSQDLYKTLIQPGLPHVKGKELLIIPHDVLHYLPFQALLAPDGQYLIEKYPINYLSSASLMQFTQEKRKAQGELTSILAQGGKVLTFGNPDLNDPKMALQFAGIEAKEIKSLYPQSSIYLEKEATEERAKSLSSQNDIIHFASHAELSEDDPLASAILLTKSDKEDGRLEVREIFGMDLKASLVVLSACETGLGKLSSGDELVGLTRAFIYAGTPSVVASLWNVEDSSTAQLMASFYKNLKTMTKVEALRQAQLQLIQGKTNSELLARRGIGGVGKLGEAANTQTPPRDAPPPTGSVSDSISVSTSHPYFWAPFILVGDGK